ncbi:hypothetical protein HOY80DRAFT_187797 [Tuber brumale]|nr:hypothetical protein HOY80DRAFT_187797 [Tuber brumale]
MLKHGSGTTGKVVTFVLLFFSLHQNLSHIWTSGTIEDASLHSVYFSFLCYRYCCYCSLDPVVSLTTVDCGGFSLFPSRQLRVPSYSIISSPKLSIPYCHNSPDPFSLPDINR